MNVLPGWNRAYEAVWRLLPSAREHITPARSCITPDSVMHRAELAGLGFELAVVPDWESHEWGQDIYSKMDLFDMMFHGVAIPTGEVIFIPDDCFPMTEREPLFCNGEILREFVAHCCFFVFDGDVVFIWPEAGRISVFHHEGRYAHINFPRL